jgi:hypothetical protein
VRLLEQLIALDHDQYSETMGEKPREAIEITQEEE